MLTNHMLSGDVMTGLQELPRRLLTRQTSAAATAAPPISLVDGCDTGKVPSTAEACLSPPAIKKRRVSNEGAAVAIIAKSDAQEMKDAATSDSDTPGRLPAVPRGSRMNTSSSHHVSNRHVSTSMPDASRLKTGRVTFPDAPHSEGPASLRKSAVTRSACRSPSGRQSDCPTAETLRDQARRAARTADTATAQAADAQLLADQAGKEAAAAEQRLFDAKLHTVHAEETAAAARCHAARLGQLACQAVTAGNSRAVSAGKSKAVSAGKPKAVSASAAAAASASTPVTCAGRSPRSEQAGTTSRKPLRKPPRDPLRAPVAASSPAVSVGEIANSDQVTETPSTDGVSGAAKHSASRQRPQSAEGSGSRATHVGHVGAHAGKGTPAGKARSSKGKSHDGLPPRCALHPIKQFL